ncbi:hypothetical protein M0812_27130 [Anaeramoeba flamelloides]|nr:hypothetical protein M0812_27130 [Anaeramoeba flamelloides]
MNDLKIIQKLNEELTIYQSNDQFSNKEQCYYLPSNNMRCDGIVPLGNDCFILIGARLHSSILNHNVAYDNIETTNFKHQFIKIYPKPQQNIKKRSKI